MEEIETVPTVVVLVTHQPALLFTAKSCEEEKWEQRELAGEMEKKTLKGQHDS